MTKQERLMVSVNAVAQSIEALLVGPVVPLVQVAPEVPGAPGGLQ